MIIEEYKEPQEFAEEGESWHIEPGSGTAFGLGTATACGRTTARCGGAPAYAPLSWGSCEAAEYAQVTGWEVVTDLDGAGGVHVPGRLLAAYWQGKIWLKLSKDGEVPPADGTGVPEGCCGAGYVGRAGAGGLVHDAPGRAVLPQVYLCPMDGREAFLKTEDGRWRGDVWWEVLANYIYHPEKGDVVKDPAGGVGYAWKNAYRVTIWVVACGNVLCFYTTRSWYMTEDLQRTAPYAERMKWSAWGVPYELHGEESRAAYEKAGGPFAPCWCARLPWEAEGTEPVMETEGAVVQEAVGMRGTENFLGRVGTVPGFDAPVAMAVPVSVCGRFHYGKMYGAAWLAMGWTVAPTVQEATGYETWSAAVRGFLVDEAAAIDHTETAQDYRFDPVSIEGKGVSFGYQVGWYTPGPEAWPEVAPPYELLAAERLESPYGALYLAIAGTTADGVLLTASCFAEPCEGMDDPENPNPPGPYPPGPFPPIPIPDPDPPEPEPGPGPSPGPGPWFPPTPDPDPDPDPDTPGGTTLEDGYFYTAGKGVAIRATRTNVKNAEGKVVGIEFGFDIDVTDESLVWNAKVRYEAEVQLGTSNGGSYTYKGKSCTMFYGFSASSYNGVRATLNWKSSHMYGDTDPKSCTVRAVVGGAVTVVAQFPQSGWADSESLAKSNILSFRNTGRKKMYSTNGVKRYFKIYTVTLKKGVLKGIALRKALEHSPQITVSPESVSGTNTGEPSGGPVVTAEAGTAKPAHSNDYADSPAAVTGCMPAEFAADFEGDAVASSVAVSGSASWHYDPNESEGSGSIDGEFKVSLKNHSSEL